MELLERLATLVPSPRFHLLRYHSILVPRARGRMGRAWPVRALSALIEGQKRAFSLLYPMALLHEGVEDS